MGILFTFSACRDSEFRNAPGALDTGAPTGAILQIIADDLMSQGANPPTHPPTAAGGTGAAVFSFSWQLAGYICGCSSGVGGCDLSTT